MTEPTRAEIEAEWLAAHKGGRTPTTAHPDCTCVEQVPNVGGTTTPVVTDQARAGCPQHGKRAR